MHLPVQENKPDRVPLASRPAFHLIYLVFYFFPWLFQAPSVGDVTAVLVALLVFLPVYFHAFTYQKKNAYPHIVIMSLIGYGVSPFFGSHGVFHIYSCALAGYLRPRKQAWLTIWGITAAYLAFSFLFQAAWWDILFPVFVALMVAADTTKDARQLRENEQMRRSGEYEQQMAKIAERERIARDLHDVLGQTLTVVALKAEIALKLMETDQAHAKQELKEIRMAAQEALKDVRKTVSGMSKTTLTHELTRAHKILSAANIRLKVQGLVPTFEEDTDHVLGLTIREAVTNIVRHSSASQAELRFDVVNASINVTLSDNGDAVDVREGSGLSGMRKRIADIGGSVAFDYQNGMRISLTLPEQS